MSCNILNCDMIGMRSKGLHFVKVINATIALSLKKIETRPWKVPGQNVMFVSVPWRVPRQSSRLPRRSQRLWTSSWTVSTMMLNRKFLNNSYSCSVLVLFHTWIHTFLITEHRSNKNPTLWPLWRQNNSINSINYDHKSNQCCSKYMCNKWYDTR